MPDSVSSPEVLPGAKILAIDTAMDQCAAAWFDGATQLLSHMSERLNRGQAERLMPMLQDVMHQASAELAVVDAIVVISGPGAFTGLRTGLAAAKGLSLALNVPLFSVSSLQGLAYTYRQLHGPRSSFMVLVESKREEYFVQSFDKHAAPTTDRDCLTGGAVVEQYEEQGLDVIGNAVQRFQEEGWAEAMPHAHFDDVYDLIDLGAVIAAFKDETLRCYFEADNRSIYLRGPDVSLPKSQPREILRF